MKTLDIAGALKEHEGIRSWAKYDGTLALVRRQDKAVYMTEIRPDVDADGVCHGFGVWGDDSYSAFPGDLRPA